jgi:cysteine desulfurase
MKKETPVPDNGIYLDHNATTPLAPEVILILHEVLDTYGNPSSRHPPGLEAKRVVERARGQVATLLGASPQEIVFTSGGSESDNLALKGITARHPRGHLISQATEHPGILAPLEALAKSGHPVTILPVDSHGLVNPSAVENALRQDTVLVSVQHANGETGTIQPLAEIGKLLRPRGILLHTDAAQSIGKINVSVDDLGVDLLTIAGHKVYAPKGVGALYVRRGVELEPIVHGAGHESGRRAGTEAVHQVAALGRACELAAESVGTGENETRRLRDLLHSMLERAIPTLRLQGHPELRLPNCLNLSFPDVDGAELLDRAPDVFASTGSACHEGIVALSPVLEAMGISPEDGSGTVRLSLGRTTTDADVSRAAESLVDAYQALTG